MCAERKQDMMGEYQRFVSYIYNYQDGKKGRNIGFAKIEGRNGVYKFNISVKMLNQSPEQEGKKLEIYLFYRTKEGIEKESLGSYTLTQSPLSQDSVSVKLTKKQEALSRSLDGYAGLFICDSGIEGSAGKEMYISQWDDLPLNPEIFDCREVSLMNLEKVPVQKSETEDRREIELANEMERSYILETEPQIQDTISEEKQGQQNRREEWKTSSYNDGDRETVLSDDREMGLTEKENQKREDTNQEEIQQGKTKKEEIELQETKREEVPPSEQSVQTETVDAEKDFFQILCNIYPKVQVREFGGECIRITPHDITYLPKEYWKLSENSFLLHGYYNYRHLILCRRYEAGVPVYILGVPGIFHQKEQAMARMFGFGSFFGKKEGIPMNVGYWCTQIRVK